MPQYSHDATIRAGLQGGLLLVILAVVVVRRGSSEVKETVGAYLVESWSLKESERASVADKTGEYVRACDDASVNWRRTRERRSRKGP